MEVVSVTLGSVTVSSVVLAGKAIICLLALAPMRLSPEGVAFSGSGRAIMAAEVATGVGKVSSAIVPSGRGESRLPVGWMLGLITTTMGRAKAVRVIIVPRTNGQC